MHANELMHLLSLTTYSDSDDSGHTAMRNIVLTLSPAIAQLQSVEGVCSLNLYLQYTIIFLSLQYGTVEMPYLMYRYWSRSFYLNMP
jgi:hypothetical protein